MTERVFILALWIRVWHWTNALLILALTASGYSLHFADPGLPLIEFSLAARIHDIAGWALVATYGVFVVGNIVSGNWYQFVLKPPVLEKIMVQARWYGYGMFKGEPEPFPVTPEQHFNPLQAMTYWAVMYLLMPVVLLSGIVFFFPQLAPDKLWGMDGLMPVALLHYLSASALVIFMVTHIYLGTTGKTITQQYKTMITGWHEH
jgi:thiosulfate reductase cytochrome b subunit